MKPNHVTDGDLVMLPSARGVTETVDAAFAMASP
jgi:hypothetical protein